jgi:hypothetical protein
MEHLHNNHATFLQKLTILEIWIYLGPLRIITSFWLFEELNLPELYFTSGYIVFKVTMQQRYFPDLLHEEKAVFCSKIMSFCAHFLESPLVKIMFLLSRHLRSPQLWQLDSNAFFFIFCIFIIWWIIWIFKGQPHQFTKISSSSETQ